MIQEEENVIKQGKRPKPKKDDEEESLDFNSDIDGVQKHSKDLRSYEQVDNVEPEQDEEEDHRERRSTS
jgi:hypothetical protein